MVASPAWSDAQKVVGVAYSPGGHVADGASHQLVQTIIDRAVVAPPCRGVVKVAVTQCQL